MAENYKHRYEQMKKMVERYQDEVFPGLWKLLKQAEQRACADGDYLNRETVVNNVLSQLAVSKSPDAMRERIMNLQGISIEQPTWISCAERLPAESGYYLVVYRDKFNGSELVSIDFYTKCAVGEWWDNDFGRTAIYWMPLPQPPKGDEG